MTTTSVEHKDPGTVRDAVEVLDAQQVHTHDDQPDPVTLSQPSFDGDGLLRWASATFNVSH